MNKNVYWANVCILIKKESAFMEQAAAEWQKNTGIPYSMTYLGDTEEVQIHEKIQEDVQQGKPGFHLLVSTRFDIFCSQTGVLAFKDLLHPVGGSLPVRPEVRQTGVEDSLGLYHPLAVLHHNIICNMTLLEGRKAPASLEELLAPEWEGQVCIGNTALPSGQAILFAMWYLFGNEGLDTCIKNWRQKSTPAAARHGLIKREYPVAILPGVFSGPGPKDVLEMIHPSEGQPILPSYAAIAKNDNPEDTLEFLKASTASREFQNFYRDMASTVVSHPEVPLPNGFDASPTTLFPSWEWILKQDMDDFTERVLQMPEV